MFKVAMLSRWHVHADGYARELQDMDDVEITAVWNEDSESGREWSEELGCDFEEDLDRLLARDDVEGVVVNAPTNKHRDIMVSAAEAEKHIFTEKVMALTVAECDDIVRAVRSAGVIFTISYPHRARSENLFARQIVEEGLLGDVTLLRIRNAHDGASSGWLPKHFYDPEACGGGALIDLGAHPMYLARWILGPPAKIRASLNSFTGKEVDDNAVAVIEFKNRALGVVETSFVSHASPFSLELHGTEGSLFVGGPEERVRLFSRELDQALEGWITPTELPEAHPAPIRQWVESVNEGATVRYGLKEGRELTELMEGAMRSHREGCEVRFK